MKTRLVNFTKTIFRGTKSLWTKYHFLVPPKAAKGYLVYLFGTLRGEDNRCYNPFDKGQYNLWLKTHETPCRYKKLDYNPLISFLVPVYNVDSKYLTECLDSILNQKYQNFEICLVDDASTNPDTIKTLKTYEQNSKIKIKYRKKNGHISRTTNDALKMAKGDFVALIDNDDVIPENALYEVVKALNEDKSIDMVYTDEDKIDLKGNRCDPHFKPDWSPDSFLSNNYMSHFGVLRKSIVDKIGGFRPGFEGAQDYDLYLRFTEQTNRIHHIPKILYHWRMIPGSTSMDMSNKNYALERGKKAIEDALKRRKLKGRVVIDQDCFVYCVYYDVNPEPKISIIIPTKDMPELLAKCLQSIYAKTTYKNFEIIVVNNNSTEPETFELFKEYQNAHNNFKVIDANFEFNYSKINNLAVKETDAEYVVLLNNDTEVITPNWLEIMVGYASQKHIGVVGVKLLYPDDTIQHGGVILGLGVAAHAFVGKRRHEIVWGGRLSVPYNYSAMTAACFMVSKKKWQEVNGLDERLKVAYNDVDFNLKLLEKGYYNVFLPMVELYHYESKSRGEDDTPEKKARFNKEQNFMYKKWHDRIKNDEFYNPNFTRRTYYMLDKDKKKKS